MSRRMTAPGVWTIEEPARPHGSRRTYASVPAENVGHMRPVIKYAGLMPKTPPVARSEPSVPLPKLRPLCRVTMPISGERCARLLGHLDSHRSRRIMDAEGQRRRGRYARVFS